MPRIFISYRRDDTSGHARGLYDRLVARFGRSNVFMDVGALKPGVDFVDAIERAVGSTDVLIAIIGKQWLNRTDEAGRRRLDDPGDFVRREIAAALGRNITVIPALVEGAAMPRPQDLPDDLVGLARRNALEISETRWDYDVGRLIEVVDAMPGQRRFMPSSVRWLLSGVAALVLVVLAAIFLKGASSLAPMPEPTTIPTEVAVSVPTATGAPTREATSTPQVTATTVPAQNLLVQIWDVELDQKHAIVATRSFTASGTALSEDMLQEVGQWIEDRLGEGHDVVTSTVEVRVRVPADLANERISVEMVPSGPAQVYVAVVAQGAKSRFPINDLAVANIGRNFALEIGRPGYNVNTVNVTWGMPLDQTFVLRAKKLDIGFEAFGGEDQLLASRLASVLATDQRFSVKDPKVLMELREQIAKNKEILAQNPMTQVALRVSLGLDYIITGQFGRT